MIYGFAYLVMVLAISAGWIILAVLKKPDFIEKPLNEVKNKIRPFLNPKNDHSIKDLGIRSFIDDFYELRSYKRGVAQLGSAGALGALGRRFESCRPDHLKTKSY